MYVQKYTRMYIVKYMPVCMPITGLFNDMVDIELYQNESKIQSSSIYSSRRVSQTENYIIFTPV